MENLAKYIPKILLSVGLMGAGIGFPLIMSTGHFLECQRNPSPKSKTSKATVNCAILEMGGGTLLTKGTKELDRRSYPNIRQAEVATIKAQLTSTTEVPRANGGLSDTSTTVQEVPIERLVIVVADRQKVRKETVEFSLQDGTAGTISNQINQLIADPTAPKFRIEVGAPARLPQVMGWIFVVGGILALLVKTEPHPSP
jgi:hypothetical protein